MKKQPKPVEKAAPSKSAREIVLECMLANNIVLVQDVSERVIRTVSDGSVIIGQPVVDFKFKK